jgi:hypothetical protein
MAKHYDHTKNQAIAKANYGLRWQFLVNRNGTEHWQTMPLNRVPMWHRDVQYRIKPGQQYKIPTEALMPGYGKALAKAAKSLGETFEKLDAVTTLGAGLDHPHAHAQLKDIIDAMQAIDTNGEMPTSFKALNILAAEELSLRQADRIVRAIAAVINKTR